MKPHFFLMVDVSGSMTASTGTGNNSCGQTRNRINDARCVIQRVVNSFGDVLFGLGRFTQTCSSGCNWNGIDCSSCDYDGSGAGCPAAGGSEDRGQILVGIAEDNQSSILGWVDFTCSGTCALSGTGAELDPGGWTPLAGSLRGARAYYEGRKPGLASPMTGDTYRFCRPHYVILLTDGEETCTTNAQTLAAATELHTTTVGTEVFDVKTYVIGMLDPTDMSAANQLLMQKTNNIAIAGGTDAPGPNQAFFAADEAALSLAFSQIIANSFLVEVCDGSDNDCDGQIDEGFELYCNLETGHTAEDLCTNPGDPCDNVDDNCFAGTTDEVKNACGTCGPTPAEICDLIDNDCDGSIDEGGVCGGCVVQPEICDGRDNDCDTRIDEGLTRSCGIDVGICTSGTQQCMELTAPAATGTWTPCTGTPPEPTEQCDGLDNDCNGLADEFSEPCGNPPIGLCRPGTRLCSGGIWGPCIGEVLPTGEICDREDNNCNNSIDEGDPGGGATCGSTCGIGTVHCVAGTLMCVGGTGGTPEQCNGIDDDCDGMVDEGLTPPTPTCDRGGTLCTPGSYVCMGTAGWVCVGGTEIGPEVCDCEDNDCDTMIDEPADVNCGAGATCLPAPYCQCARPCADDEFPCPIGQMCTPTDFCIPDPCYNVTCNPGTDGNPTECVDGVCVPLCDSTNCTAPLVCRPSDGDCVEDNCNGFPERCAPDELCFDGVCEGDPCDGVSCPDLGEYCYMGNCVGTCAGVDCPDGQSCSLGTCVPDACDGVICTIGVCDPATGACVTNQCGGVPCGSGQVCDPVTGNCERDPCSGVVCPAPNQVCRAGSCFTAASDIDAGMDPRAYVTPGGEGCACEVGGGSGIPLGALLLLGVATVLLVSRRRR